MAEMITIRQCLPDDIEAVLELWRQAGSTPSITDTPEYLWGTVDSDASSILLAMSNGTVAGSIIAGFDGWRGSIYRLAVHPDHQRQGIAQRLVFASERWLREKGAVRVSAVVEQDHPWAIAFWESVAFFLEPLDLRYVKNL